MDRLSDDAVTTGLRAVNAASPFNVWAGLELGEIGDGTAELRLSAKPEMLNHTGTLHAGMTSALLDTVAGYAAATRAGAVVTVSLNISFLGASAGPVFVARASTVKAGRRQVFVDSRLFALRSEGEEKLLATANVVLMPL